MDGRWVIFRGALLVSIGASALACVEDRRPPTACDAPMDVLQAAGEGQQEPTGWETCSNGFSHRPQQRECLYPPELVGSCNGEGFEGDACRVDADCTERPHGFCNGPDPFVGGCYCNYGCESDADCGEDQACYCAGATSFCVMAYCRTDDDCPSGYFCALLDTVLACQTPDDECRSRDECTAGSCPRCQYNDNDDAWECNPEAGFCGVGRPFTVDGRARTAAPIESRQWCGDALPEIDGLADDVRACLAAHWTEVALAEHASVPAFARFALELAALAAPADLLAECARAMSDEIVHAQLAFALASRYRGAPVGPGALATGDALPRRVELVAVAQEVIREACIGETLAAIEAAHARELAVDPHVRAALATIAADELRHAQLGWRFLAWALGQADADEARRILRACDDAIAEVRRAPAPREDVVVEARAHGCLDARTKASLRTEAITQVIAPVLATLRHSQVGRGSGQLGMRGSVASQPARSSNELFSEKSRFSPS